MKLTGVSIIDPGDQHLVVPSELQGSILDVLPREVLDHVFRPDVNGRLPLATLLAMAAWPFGFVWKIVLTLIL